MSFKMYYSAEAPFTSIEKQQIAVVDDRPRHSHAMLLSAGELVGFVVQPLA